MQKTASYILILLALVPLVVFNTLNPTLDTKVLIYRGAAFVVMLLLCIITAQKEQGQTILERFQKVVRAPLFIAMVIAVFLLIISTFFAYDRYVAFFGEVLRGEGFLTLFALYALYVSAVLLFQKKQWRLFFVLTSVAGICLFLYEIWQSLHGESRPSSFMGNPIFLSAFYLFSIFSGWYLCARKEDIEKKDRLRVSVLGITTIVTSLVGILITETRSALVGLAVAFLICVVIALVKGKERMIGNFSLRKIAMTLILIFILFLTLFVSTFHSKVWQSIPGLNRIAQSDISNVNSRLIYLDITRRGFLESALSEKIFGWGWDNYQFFWNKNYDPKVYFYDTGNVDRAHNKLADALIMTGILGLLSYLAIWFFLFRQGFKILGSDFVLGLGVIFFGISYFVHNLFALDIPVTLFSFYMFLAFITDSYFYEEK